MSSRTPRIGRNQYREIVAVLRGRIEAGDIAPGHFIATERELQAEFGASRSTVRKVLSELVEGGWAVNIPKKGVFAGRGFIPNHSNQIAMVENGTLVQKHLAKRLSTGLNTSGYSIEGVGGTSLFPLEYALQQVLDGGYAGAFVWCFHSYPDPDLVARLTREVPVVALHHRLGKADTDLVTFDHEAAAYELTTHLIKQGAKRIGITGMLDTLDVTVSRIQGYMRAMFDNDLRPNPSDYIFTITSGETTYHPELLEHRLRSPYRPDALVILQDMCAPTTVEAALRAGLSLPRDLKLGMIGDDVRVSVNGVGMTAIRHEWDHLADEARALMAERLADLHRPSQTRWASHRLMVRGLCGAATEPNSSRSAAIDGTPTYDFTSAWSVQTDARP